MAKPSSFDVTPLSPALGAKISGLNLAGPLGETVIAELRQALLDHEVLFFEDQDITPIQQRDFAARFGKLHLHPIRPSVPGIPEVLVLDSQPGSDTDTGNWRSDVTFIETPPMATLLYAQEVPERGGDTLWSSMRAAYDGLSPSIRAFLAPLDAEHDFALSFPPDHLVRLSIGIERYAWARREYPPVVHPVVRTHRELRLHDEAVGTQQGGKRESARASGRAHPAAGIRHPPAVEAGHARVLGQSGHSALHGRRLHPPSPRHAPRDDPGRQAIQSGAAEAGGGISTRAADKAICRPAAIADFAALAHWLLAAGRFAEKSIIHLPTRLFFARWTAFPP